MRIGRDTIYMEKRWVAYNLCYELQQIACWATENPQNLAQHQKIFEGAVSLLGLEPDEYNALLRPVYRAPADGYIVAAYRQLVKLFGQLPMTLQEVLGHGT